jgi:hypothetical protein
MSHHNESCDCDDCLEEYRRERAEELRCDTVPAAFSPAEQAMAKELRCLRDSTPNMKVVKRP